MRSLPSAVVLAGLLVGGGGAAQGQPRASGDDGVAVRSLYVPMRDGVRIAVDVALPAGLSPLRKLPALLKISRFGRAPRDGSVADEDRFWVEHGFARVLIDERGTGASFGTSRYGTATIPDLADLVGWIVAQPWSDGKVGAIGVSVEGTAAELLAATGRPEVAAVAPWFSDYDYYTDLVRPGGVYNEWLLTHLAAFTARMDGGEAAKPVDGDHDGALLQAALSEHRGNVDIAVATRRGVFADDQLPGVRRTLRELSTPGVARELRRARVPMLILVSWFDAGTVQGALARFRTFANPQDVYIGAWSHGGGFDADPFDAAGTPVEPTKERQRLMALDFFSRLLKGSTWPRRIHYYTVGEGAWHESPSWPPAGLRPETLHLGADGSLAARARGGARPVPLTVTSTGEANRWHTQLGGHAVRYAEVLDRMAELPAYTTAPLASGLEITGQPILRLRLSCGARDPAVFAYLLAVDPRGRAFYLTEGQLRLVDRKLAPSEPTLHTYRRQDAAPVLEGRTFAADVTLLPISAWLPPGFRLRLALAAGDASTFERAEEYQAAIDAASTLVLPARRRPASRATPWPGPGGGNLR